MALAGDGRTTYHRDALVFALLICRSEHCNWGQGQDGPEVALWTAAPMARATVRRWQPEEDARVPVYREALGQRAAQPIFRTAALEDGL